MGGFWQLIFACCLLVRALSAQDMVTDSPPSAVTDNPTSAVKDNPTSAVNPDEELEKNIGPRIASLQEMGQDEIHNFANLALQYHNMRETSLFTTLGKPTVTVKIAIGTMVYLRMTLEKTNCTKKDVNLHHRFDISRHLEPNEDPPKYCGPLNDYEKEQLDCKFDILKNERFYGEAVVSHDCKPVRVIDRDILMAA